MAHGIQISIDGEGHWVDNVFFEHLWHGLKYQEMRLKAHDILAQATQGVES